MKIAICGKGGSGKSTISGTLARQLARTGARVVAIDADPNPNLGISLGVDRDLVEHLRPILNALLDAGHTHDDPTPAAEQLLADYGVDAPDGIRLVATGKIERPSGSCLCCGSHNTTRQFFGELSDEGRIVIADLEAGLNDLIWASPGEGDTVLAVTEGSVKSVEVARRGVGVARDLGVQRIIGVANRTRDISEVERIRVALGVEEIVMIPDDPAVGVADHEGVALIDRDPSAPAVLAIATLAELLRGAAAQAG